MMHGGEQRGTGGVGVKWPVSLRELFNDNGRGRTGSTRTGRKTGLVQIPRFSLPDVFKQLFQFFFFSW